MDTIGYCECDRQGYFGRVIQIEQPILFFAAPNNTEDRGASIADRKRRWHGRQLTWQFRWNGEELYYHHETTRYDRWRRQTAQTVIDRGNADWFRGGYQEPIRPESILIDQMEHYLVQQHTEYADTGDISDLLYSWDMFDEYTESMLQEDVNRLKGAISWSDFDPYEATSPNGLIIAHFGALPFRIPITRVTKVFIPYPNARTDSTLNTTAYIACRLRTEAHPELTPVPASEFFPLDLYANGFHVESKSMASIVSDPYSPGYGIVNYTLTKVFDGEEIQTEPVALTEEPQLFEMPQGKFGYMQLFPS